MTDLLELDETLCECPMDSLAEVVAGIERSWSVSVVTPPAVCMTMLRAEDSLDGQEFYLAEALTTDCEVAVEGHSGYGICLGDEPQRAYCQAVIDAVMHGGLDVPGLHEFLAAESAAMRARIAREFNLTLQTQVDFKLMEEE